MSEEDIRKGNSQLALVPSLGVTLYPPPLAKYEEVVANATLFVRTLEKLHTMMGTKFMVPTIGGKELDLHRLFVEVTSRGGLDKVIKERKWKEITSVFNFPSTATNASFILRKYYVSLIHHYEQIYFFRAQAWTAPVQTLPPTTIPTQGSVHSVEPLTPSSIQSATQKGRKSSGEVLPRAPVQTLPPTTIPTQGSVHSVEPLTPSSIQSATQKGRKSSGEVLPRASTPSLTSCRINGVIDGKFDHGYLVTVRVGTQKLKGVLYHTTEYLDAGIPRDSGVVHNGNKDSATSGIRRRRRRKKSELRKRDPYHPKPNRSGYNFFFAEQHARLKLLHSGKDREISRMIGELWNKLTETEKSVYQERGVKDKERYQSEMEEYRERLKMGPIISNAVPIQQRLSEPDSEMVDVDSKMETEEGCLPLALENGSSSDGSDSEEKTLDSNLELVKPPETGSVTETSKIIAEVSTGDGFELQRRNSVEMDSSVPVASLGDESELMKKDPATEMDSSNVPGASLVDESELMKKDPASESESIKKDTATESELMMKDPATESESMKKDLATEMDISNVPVASLGDVSESMKQDPASESETMNENPSTDGY